MRFRGFGMKESIQGITDRPKYTDAEDIAHRIATLYTSHDLDKVHLVYNHFKSPVEQIVTDQVILPLGRVAGGGRTRAGDRRRQENSRAISSTNPVKRRSWAALVAHLRGYDHLPGASESTASEHGARMTAMRNASDNAGRDDRQADAGYEQDPVRRLSPRISLRSVAGGAPKKENPVRDLISFKLVTEIEER